MTKTNLKRRIVSLVIALATVLTAIPLFAMNVKAAVDNQNMSDYVIADDSDTAVPAASSTDYNGGEAITLVSMTVYNERGCKTVKGSLYKYEGFTILRKDTSTVYFIQYSTPNGARRGYIKVTSSNIEDYSNTSCVALVKSNTTVYYGNSTTVYEKAGSVDKGEYVVILAEYKGWYYIEYNTTSGRKRGYVTTSSLTPYYKNNLGSFYLNSTSSNNNPISWKGKHTVYAGPSTQYVDVGYVKDETTTVKDQFRMFNNFTFCYFIVYKIDNSSKYKTGFVIEDFNQ